MIYGAAWLIKVRAAAGFASGDSGSMGVYCWNASITLPEKAEGSGD